MTTDDVIEQILNEMHLKWKFHDGGSYYFYIIDCHCEDLQEIMVFCGETSIKLSLWDRLDRVEIYAKEIDLYHPNSILEIKQLLFLFKWKVVSSFSSF